MAAHIYTGLTGMEAMRHFIPAGFEASNGVLIALLGLCLRSRHISSARNGDVVAYFALLKRWSISCVMSHTEYFSQAVHTMHHNDNEQRKRQERISLLLRWDVGCGLLALSLNRREKEKERSFFLK